jgi:hypothetical protein
MVNKHMKSCSTSLNIKPTRMARIKKDWRHGSSGKVQHEALSSNPSTKGGGTENKK